MATTDWIPLKEAAALMKQNEKKLRAKNALGEWLWFPELSRIRPGGPSSQIWMFRSEIEQWIERVEEEARRRTIAIIPNVRGIGENEALLQQLERMGAHKTVERLRLIR